MKKKTLKIIFKILGAIFLILIVGIILIPIIFKGKIIKIAQEEANKNLNAVIKFEDVNLSLIRSFPDLSVELKELSIVGIDTFEKDTFVAFKSFYAGLNLMSVISGDEIKVNAIILDNPNINAKVLSDGTANWDIAPTDTSATNETDTIPDEDEGGESKFKINLKKFEIKNANIIYDDKSSNIYSKISNFNFVLKGDMSQDFTNLNIKLGIDSLTAASGGIKYLNKTKIGFTSDIAADLKNLSFEFKENRFKLNEIVLDFDGKVAMPDTNIVCDITFKTSKTNFKSVLSLIPVVYMNDFKGVKTAGVFKINGYAKGTYNARNMPAFGINLLVDNARFQYPDLPKSVENITIKLKVDAKEGTGNNMIIDLKKAHIEIGNNPFDAKLLAKMTAVDIALDGEVKGKIDLNSMKDVLPIEDMKLNGVITADLNFKGNMSDIENEEYEKFKAVGSLGIEKFEMKSEDMPIVKISKAFMNFSPQFVDIKQFDAKAGKSDFHLNGRVDNILSYVFKDELLSGTFNFTSDYLNVNEFMVSSDEGGTAPEQEENTADSTQTASDGVLKIPENLNFTLNSKLKKIIYDEIEISNTEGKIVVNGGKLLLDKLKMELLEGSMFMSGSYDSKNIEKPIADFNFNISGFDIRKTYDSFLTVKEIAPITKNCVGKISASLSLNTVLDKEMSPVYNTLNSKGSFSSANIGINDNNIFNQLSDITKLEEFRNPKLKNIHVAYKIKNGNLTIEPTSFKIGGGTVSFAGTQSLDKSIDFDLGMQLPQSAAKQVLSKLPIDGLPDKIDVTAKIGGTVTDPKITKFESNLTNSIKDRVKEEIKKVKEDVKEEARKILADAQKHADRVIAEAKTVSKNIKKEADKAGKKVINESKKQGKELIKKAGNNIIKRKIAEETSKKLEKEARKKAKQLNQKADKESKKIIKKAENESKKIMDDAKKRVEKL